MIKAGEELLRLQAENIRLKEGIKQAREEIKHYEHGNGNMYTCGLNKAVEILDKLIESEG